MDFFQEQILGMKWLNDVIGLALSSMGADLNNSWIASLQFFIYDVIKIVVLLCILIFVISYIQSYFPPERSKKILGKFRGIWANIIGALLGTITPFCSCSSIPLFIGFTSAKVPIGVTFSFLISSPMVDLASVTFIASVFGIKVAAIYVVVGLVIAVLGGTLIEKLGMEKYIAEDILGISSVDVESPDLTQKDRLKYSLDQVWSTFKKVIPYILIGVGIGALIHNQVPADIISGVLGPENPANVLIATVFGIPIYSDIFGVLPIAEALFAKGAALGAVLSLMMAVTTLSLPSLIMLKKVVKWKLLLTFIGVCTVGIVIIGYVFNAIQPFIQ